MTSNLEKKLPLLGTSLLVGADGATGIIIVREFKKYQQNFFAPPLEELDYRNISQIHSIISKTTPEIIFLVGAYTNVDKGEYEDKELCWNINRDGIATFLQTIFKLQNQGIYTKQPKIIFISTDMVGSGDHPLKENENVWDIPKAVNEYGKSKLAGENIIQEFHKKNPERFSYHIVRIATPFSGLRKGSFLTLLHNSVKEKKSVQLVTDQYVTPTYAEDLAWNLILIAQYGKEKVYHDAPKNEKPLSVYDIGKNFAQICGWNSIEIKEMKMQEMYKNGWWRAPRGHSNELEIKNLLSLPSPIPPKIHSLSQVLTEFKKLYIDHSIIVP